MASPSADKIIAAALELPVKARERVIRELIASIDDQRDEGVEEAWRDEIERRVRDVDEGRAKLVDGDAMFRRVRSKLASRRR